MTELVFRWLDFMDKHSGGLQFLVAVVIAALTALLIWWTRRYTVLMQQAVAESRRQADISEEQAQILRDQWNSACQPQLTLRIPVPQVPFQLEMVNVGQPTIVVRKIACLFPVSERSMSPVEARPTMVMRASDCQTYTLGDMVHDFIRTREIELAGFHSAVQVMVLFESGKKAFGEAMWAYIEWREGRFWSNFPPPGSNLKIRFWEQLDMSKQGPMEPFTSWLK